MNDKKIPQVFQDLNPHIDLILEDPELASLQVKVVCRTLTAEEALGNPGRDDFPLQKGKEKLMQAEIEGYAGQAFTDRPGNIEGILAEILSLPPVNNFNRAAIIATLNAVVRRNNKVERTVHCKDDGPTLCSKEIVEEIKSIYGNQKIALIGLQPALAESLSTGFQLRIFDLDQNNSNKSFNDVKVETGEYSISEVENWADLLLVTGSTIINGSIDDFLELEKPVVFFGTSIAAAAELLDLKRFCPRAS